MPICVPKVPIWTLTPNFIIWPWNQPKNGACLSILSIFFNFSPFEVVFAHLGSKKATLSEWSSAERLPSGPLRCFTSLYILTTTTKFWVAQNKDLFNIRDTPPSGQWCILMHWKAMIELGITKALRMDQPTDGQKEIWVRQQPPLVVDVLESCFDVIHDFYAFRSFLRLKSFFLHYIHTELDSS